MQENIWDLRFATLQKILQCYWITNRNLGSAEWTYTCWSEGALRILYTDLVWWFLPERSWLISWSDRELRPRQAWGSSRRISPNRSPDSTSTQVISKNWSGTLMYVHHISLRFHHWTAKVGAADRSQARHCGHGCLNCRHCRRLPRPRTPPSPPLDKSEYRVIHVMGNTRGFYGCQEYLCCIGIHVIWIGQLLLQGSHVDRGDTQRAISVYKDISVSNRPLFPILRHIVWFKKSVRCVVKFCSNK